MPSVSPLVFAGCLGSSFFPCLALGEQFLGPVDVKLQTALGTATEQHDQPLAILGQIDPIPGASVDHIFAQPIEPFHMRCVAQFKSQVGSDHLGCSLSVDLVEPGFIGVRAILAQILFDSKSHSYW
jgi:hypothetical protein